MDDRTAQRRLLTYTFVRLLCLGLFFIGVAIIYTDVARPGGWPQFGAILCIAGVLAALGLPHLIKKKWDRDGK